MKPDEWAARESASRRTADTILATVDIVEGDSEALSIAPFTGQSAGSASVHRIPREHIQAIEPTSTVAWGANGLEKVWAVTFAQSQEFPVQRFIQELHRARRPAPRNTSRSEPRTDRNLSDAASRGSERDVIHYFDYGAILRESKMHACGGTAGWGEAIKCGTMFLGDSKIVIRYGDPEAGSAPNVGIVGLNPSEPILVTLHPRFAAIYEGWFWGRDIYVYHTYVNADGVHGGGTITVSH